MRIPRYVTLGLLAATVALGTTVSVSRAEACRCQTPASPADALIESQFVFSGTVTHRVVVGDVAVTQFAVTAIYTDVAVADGASLLMTVTNGVQRCELDMAVGTQYIVYADASETTGLLWPERCGRTNLIEYAQEDLLALGLGTLVAPTAIPVGLSDESYAAIARLAALAMGIPATNVPTVEHIGTEVIVEFPYPATSRGPDYYAHVTLDAETGAVLEVHVPG